MDAVLAALIISTPIILIGLLLHLWVNRVRSDLERLRRRRLLFVTVFTILYSLWFFVVRRESDGWIGPLVMSVGTALILWHPELDLIGSKRKE